jgi:3-(methylthio)propionyl---CoA ligase
MQPQALTVDKFLDHAAKWWGDEIAAADAGLAAARIGYAELSSRSGQVCKKHHANRP